MRPKKYDIERSSYGNGEYGSERGSDEARNGGDAVGDSHDGTGVRRGDVHVIDEEAGQSEPAERRRQDHQRHRQPVVGASEEAETDQQRRAA